MTNDEAARVVRTLAYVLEERVVDAGRVVLWFGPIRLHAEVLPVEDGVRDVPSWGRGLEVGDYFVGLVVGQGPVADV